jgi:uncharacterized protein (DUF302 family)
MESNQDIVTLPALLSVSGTTEAIENALTTKGIFIYARINQEAEAHKVGLTLKPMILLIFGNPKVGIPLMNVNPLVGIDLPLKILIWEDDNQKIWLSYNSFDYLQKRFKLPPDLIDNISGIEKLIQQTLNK